MVTGRRTFKRRGVPKIPLNDLYFASRHPGGAHFCLADGSVHFVRDTIDLTVLQDLATKAGGEVGPEEF